MVSPDNEYARLRKRLGLTQQNMAQRMLLSLRAWQDIEAGNADKASTMLAAQWVALQVAVEQGDPSLATEMGAGVAKAFAKLGDRPSPAWKAYHMSPIDYGWDWLPTLEEAASQIARAEAADLVNGYGGSLNKLAQLSDDYRRAQDLAKQVGWEGDFRPGSAPRVFFLPTDGEFRYAFAWKQDNNGSTFVIAPERLAWLDAFI